MNIWRPRKLGRRREGKGGKSVINTYLAYIKVLFRVIRQAIEKTLILVFLGDC